MLRASDHTLCVHHARLEEVRQREQQEIAVQELLAGIPDFASASSVNLFLGNVAKQLVHKRISRLDAIALTYISQSLLNSHVAVEREFNIALDAARHEERLDGVFRLVPGTSRVPVPPTASAFRDAVKVRMESGPEPEPGETDGEHDPLPDSPSDFADAVAEHMPGANGNRAKQENSAEPAKRQST